MLTPKPINVGLFLTIWCPFRMLKKPKPLIDWQSYILNEKITLISGAKPKFEIKDKIKNKDLSGKKLIWVKLDHIKLNGSTPS